MNEQNMGAQLKNLALNVDAADAKATEVAARHSAVADQAQTLRARIAEERAKVAKAVADYRAGVIDVGVAGVIQKAAELDIADLEKVLASESEKLSALGSELTRANAALVSAQNAFRDAETTIACNAFDLQIKALERRLCDALVERYNMRHRTRNTLWEVWTPSPELKDAVEKQTLPIRR